MGNLYDQAKYGSPHHFEMSVFDTPCNRVFRKESSRLFRQKKTVLRHKLTLPPEAVRRVAKGRENPSTLADRFLPRGRFRIINTGAIAGRTNVTLDTHGKNNLEQPPSYVGEILDLVGPRTDIVIL